MKLLNKGTLIARKGLLLEIQEVINYKYKGENKIKYKCYERLTSGLIRTTKTFIIKEIDLIKYKILDWTF